MVEDIFEKYRRKNFKGDYLDIPPDEWEKMKESFPQDVVKKRLAEICMEYPLPMVDITEQDAKDEYRRLKGVRWNEMLVEDTWFSRKSTESEKYPLTFNNSQWMFKRYNGGNKASDYFHQYNRWTVSGSQGPGPVRTWENHKFMESLMGALYTLKMDRVDKSSLRAALSLRKYICSQFKPSVAKSIYDYFKAETILDFSMGWGDRLAGFYASEYGKHYIGIDPREENHPIYNEQVKFYEKHNGFFEHKRTTEFHIKPAEDFDFEPYSNSVDLIFTSPPYFNIERYSDSDTQSWVRYKKIDAWNELFLHKALGNMIQTLKPGGIMAINISDVYSTSGSKKEYLSIVVPMCEFLESRNMKYKGCIGMEFPKRPNSGGAGTARVTDVNNWSDDSVQLAEESRDVKFGEPIWLFEK